MSKKDLTNCEYLFPDKQKYYQGMCGKYTKYMCNIDNTRCFWVKVPLVKLWKMTDDLNLERVKECPKRKKQLEKI